MFVVQALACRDDSWEMDMVAISRHSVDTCSVEGDERGHREHSGTQEPLEPLLRLAKAGQIVEITYWGKPVGRIVTVASSVEERIEATRRSGLLSWNGRKLEPLKPVAKLRTKKTVAELVVEDR